MNRTTDDRSEIIKKAVVEALLTALQEQDGANFVGEAFQIDGSRLIGLDGDFDLDALAEAVVTALGQQR